MTKTRKKPEQFLQVEPKSKKAKTFTVGIACGQQSPVSSFICGVGDLYVDGWPVQAVRIVNARGWDSYTYKGKTGHCVSNRSSTIHHSGVVQLIALESPLSLPEYRTRADFREEVNSQIRQEKKKRREGRWYRRLWRFVSRRG